MRPGFHRGQHQVAQERLAGIFARAGGALQDHGAFHASAACMIAWICSMLFTLNAGSAVAMLGRVVEQLPHRNQRHGRAPQKK
jgi:hypothetical protein